jgi:hypothetical protein
MRRFVTAAVARRDRSGYGTQPGAEVAACVAPAQGWRQEITAGALPAALQSLPESGSRRPAGLTQ